MPAPTWYAYATPQNDRAEHLRLLLSFHPFLLHYLQLLASNRKATRHLKVA